MIEPDEIDWLAAQYALGALSPAERRLLQARLGQDQLLASSIAAWEQRLAPLNLREPGVTPPPRVLEGLLATIAQQRVSQQMTAGPAATATPSQAGTVSRRTSLRLAFAASLAVLGIGFGAVVVERLARPADQISGFLTPAAHNASADEPARVTGAAFSATLDVRTGLLTILRTTGETPRTDRMLLLWSVSDDGGSTVALGRLKPEGQTELTLDAQAVRRLERDRLLVTLEADRMPARPRGQVVASGRLLRSR